MQNSSAARGMVDVGTVIAETYTIEALLGRGGMGSVFLASHNRLPGKKIAIKMLHPDLADEEVLARFKREAQIATQLDHPNIVRVDDFITLPDGTPCMLLEYLQGETLAQRLRAGPLPLEQALSIVRQVGSALSAAHRAGIVHRDLKPQNIFLVASEHDGRATEIAKVLDFGISKIRGSQTVKTQESSLLGTPQYMAPEQATGQHTAVDERTDVFAFGAIVYEMLAGQPAFQGASIPEVVFKVVYEQPTPLTTLATTIPTAVTDAVTHAMMKKADQRYANINAFIEALTGQPISQFRLKKVPLPESTLAAGTREQDAFAQTVGSGDHKASIPALPPVNAMAATVDSQSRTRGADTQQAAGGSIDTLPSPPPVMARRSPLVVLAIALGVAAIAGAIAFFATRSSPPPPPPPAPPVAIVEPAKAVDALPAPPPPDAPAVMDQVVPVPPIDAGAPRHAPPPPPPPVVPDPKVYENEVEAQAALEQFEAAFRNGDCASATRGAHVVERLRAPRPAQKEVAFGVIGACACIDSSDQSSANAALRNTRPGGAAARRIQESCRQQGISVGR